eukprot:6080302-Pleurochrysis_carterae.AAC.1
MIFYVFRISDQAPSSASQHCPKAEPACCYSRSVARYYSRAQPDCGRHQYGAPLRPWRYESLR